MFLQFPFLMCFCHLIVCVPRNTSFLVAKITAFATGDLSSLPVPWATSVPVCRSPGIYCKGWLIRSQLVSTQRYRPFTRLLILWALHLKNKSCRKDIEFLNYETRYVQAYNCSSTEYVKCSTGATATLVAQACLLSNNCQHQTIATAN